MVMLVMAANVDVVTAAAHPSSLAPLPPPIVGAGTSTTLPTTTATATRTPLKEADGAGGDGRMNMAGLTVMPVQSVAAAGAMMMPMTVTMFVADVVVGVRMNAGMSVTPMISMLLMLAMTFTGRMLMTVAR